MADEITVPAQTPAVGEPGTPEGGFDLETIKQLLFAMQNQPDQPVEAMRSVLSQHGRGARFALGFFNPQLASELRREDADINLQNRDAAAGQSSAQQEKRRAILGKLADILRQEGIGGRAERQLAINEAEGGRQASSFEGEQAQAAATLTDSARGHPLAPSEKPRS